MVRPIPWAAPVTRAIFPSCVLGMDVMVSPKRA